jgi:hypothetical protein
MTELERYERFSIEISQDGLAEMNQRRRNVFVPRAEITRVELAYGLGSERPVLVGVLGVVMLLVGAFPLYGLSIWWREGGVFPGYAIMICAFLFLGVWLLIFAFRRRLHLRVHTRRGPRKLLFHGKFHLDGLLELLQVAEQAYGFSIKNGLRDSDLRKIGLSPAARA